jgi:hypothetical protein
MGRVTRKAGHEGNLGECRNGVQETVVVLVDRGDCRRRCSAPFTGTRKRPEGARESRPGALIRRDRRPLTRRRCRRVWWSPHREHDRERQRLASDRRDGRKGHGEGALLGRLSIKSLQVRVERVPRETGGHRGPDQSWRAAVKRGSTRGHVVTQVSIWRAIVEAGLERESERGR